MHDSSGPLGRVDDFMSRAVQNLVVVSFHPNADTFVRETRQWILLALQYLERPKSPKN